MNRIMGIDVGDRRIGIAVSDALKMTAQGLETIQVKEDDPKADKVRIESLIEAHDVDTLVVGWPKNMDGTVGERGKLCEAYADELKDRTGLSVVLQDERLTTRAAERTLIEADMSRKKRKKVVDQMAAQMILQNYLDQQSIY
ncbi:putative Holliday junction resolvase [Salsuginibacillus halophilus]|uniref:Putative pre-16S rRNA nuclease n=1 Tax=Salsuginibacillus halophilus TaxID=517424 RepID=A0A2P8HFV5_9BACI|nr:Holliday junction resolvase RuvX [Salsuginibacillus halophilus]PSL45083.1 putative Holliday junction resolvase [Salsuginibacillus halophilus]